MCSIHNLCCTFILKSFHNSFFSGWINYFKDIFSDDESAEDQGHLPSLDLAQLALNHIHVTAEHVWEYIESSLDDQCNNLGDFSICLGMICVPNWAKIICGIAKVIGKTLSYALLVSATIAFQAVDDTKSRITMCG